VHHSKTSDQIGVDHIDPGLFVVIHNTLGCADSGGIDHNIDRAKIGFSLADKPRYAGTIAHIQRPCINRCADVGQLLLGFSSYRSGAQSDCRTLARKAQRTGKANTGKPTGDNCHPSLEVL
jgi:hypothetical protein